MKNAVLLSLAVVAVLAACTGDDSPVSVSEERKGEGEGEEGEGEGEGEGEHGEGEGEEGEGEGEGEGSGEGEGEGEGEVASFTDCFSNIRSATGVSPDYDQFRPTVGSHCRGTNHQTIANIERVVFLGDSVTVGSPPTASSDFYRAKLADLLATRFGLEAPSATWKGYNALGGTSLIRHSGAFWSCAAWGARVDDLKADGAQIDDCFPAEERAKKTLVIMTMGGNDIAGFTKDGLEGKPLDEIRTDVELVAARLEDAVRFLKDPAEFPAGNDVVFANPPEFTDGTGDVTSCPAANVAGFSESWEDPTAQARLVVYLLEQYMRIAVDTGSDLVLFLENFCGHGFRSDDADSACYRGPDTERWFDLTCIHPNPTGHGELARMFLDVISE